MNCTNGLPSDTHDVIREFQTRFERAQRQFRDRSIPVTTLTYAQSLDGCIAAAGGETLQLSNPESQRLTHRLRALHDAIIVGINTVLSDDPRLNVRLVEGTDPQPVVVDSRLRFPLGARLLGKPGVQPIIVTGDKACAEKESQLVEAGVRVVRLPLQENGLLNLEDVLTCLKKMGIRTVMIEGGARIITSVLASGLADQLVLTISPTFAGGLPSVAPRDALEGGRLPRLQNVHYESLAGDLVIRGDLRRDPNESSQESSEMDRAAKESSPRLVG